MVEPSINELSFGCHSNECQLPTVVGPRCACLHILLAAHQMLIDKWATEPQAYTNTPVTTSQTLTDSANTITITVPVFSSPPGGWTFVGSGAVLSVCVCRKAPPLSKQLSPQRITLTHHQSGPRLACLQWLGPWVKQFFSESQSLSE